MIRVLWLVRLTMPIASLMLPASGLAQDRQAQTRRDGEHHHEQGTPKQEADDRTQGAREAFTAGQQSFREHDYITAETHFRHALALQPHGAAHFNLARTLERLGRLREARHHYELARDSGQLQEDAVAEIDRVLPALLPRLATVAVDAPTGATATLEDNRSCVVPCEFEVDPGSHQIRIAIGQQDVTERFTAEPGGRTRLLAPALASIVPDATSRPPHTLPDNPVDGRATSESTPPVFLAVGASLAAIGIAGTIGFGIRGLDIESQFNETPTQSLLDEAGTVQDLTNASVGVAALGGVLIGVQVAFWLTESDEGTP